MSTYLDEYGAADARREKIIKISVASLVLVAILAGLVWYFFRDYREQQRVKAFLNELQEGNYAAAYAMWGCSVEHPCENYSYETFMKDWGPDATGEGGTIQATSKHSCSTGVIQTVQVGMNQYLLWVDRQDPNLAFAPWEVCVPEVVRNRPTSP
jgi:hypothetical protein